MDWLSKEITIVAGFATILIGLSTGLFWIGGVSRQVEINTIRLENIEKYGSPAVQRQFDRLDAMEHRVTELEYRINQHIDQFPRWQPPVNLDHGQSQGR